MPHTTLEFSGNIQRQIDFKALFSELHETLANIVSTQVSSCKSRVVKCDSFCVGDGADENAFVHLHIQLMPGRTLEIRQQLTHAVLALLKRYYADAMSDYQLQITLDVSELSGVYSKIST